MLNDYEYVESSKDYEMRSNGFEFVTNFLAEKESRFRKAAEIHGIVYMIEDEVYNKHGNKIDNPELKAFYVHFSHNDLTDFWETVG